MSIDIRYVYESVCFIREKAFHAERLVASIEVTTQTGVISSMAPLVEVSDHPCGDRAYFLPVLFPLVNRVFRLLLELGLSAAEPPADGAKIPLGAAGEGSRPGSAPASPLCSGP